ncbi:MAG TPA: nitroreductase family protein [Opitutaceae bacterium]|nr:nitroreductase family protein [Opitutaceae bacterium]
MSDTPFFELVRQARSIRRFIEADPIPAGIVRRLVDIARFVPSASNQQPLRYRLVTEEDERGRVFPYLRWASALKHWAGPAQGERPTAYILIVKGQGRHVGHDAGIAAQTIQLAATAAGYGACIMDAMDREALHHVLGLMPELEIELVLALGRPAEKVELEELLLGGSRAYWRTTDQVHHVPKRRLEDVLIA